MCLWVSALAHVTSIYPEDVQNAFSTHGIAVNQRTEMDLRSLVPPADREPTPVSLCRASNPGHAPLCEQDRRVERASWCRVLPPRPA